MSKYFHPDIECASPEKLREIQSQRLVETVQYVYEHVPYYRDLMDKKGVTPADIRSVDDLPKLPFLKKDDLREAYPYGMLAVPIEDVVRIHSTSGTTGKRVVAFYTQEDIDLWDDCCARALVAAGADKSDKADAGGVILSVITNIGLDHTQFLGDTLEKIAGEKAGIIKEGVPVVIGETQPETAPLFLRVAAERHAPITFADQHYVVDDISRYTTELTGEYQKHNIATVLEAVEVLRQTKHLTLKSEHLLRGLAHVVTNTHLHGRWQKIGEAPLTICETAHNAPGVQSMLRGVDSTPHNKLHVVYGCVNDKDFSAILLMLKDHFPADTRWYFSQPSVPRGLPVAQLQAAAETIGLHGDAYERVGEAVTAARLAAQPDDFVLVTGSIFLVADALAFTNNGEPSV